MHALGHPICSPSLWVPPFIPKESPNSLSLESTGVLVKIAVYFVPSGSDFNLSVL